MFRVELNAKHNFLSFYCPITRLNLNLGQPVGYSDKLTPYILKGLKTGRIIDVDGMIDLEIGDIKNTEVVETLPEEKKIIDSSEELENVKLEKEEKPKKANKKKK
jgi:hypothetical protein